MNRLRIPGSPSRRKALPQSKAGRAGTSLVEVLMSMLVMGVGVVTVATLFPISVMQSIKATQLTNATILRYNAEATIAAMPELLSVVPNGTAIAPAKAIVDPLGYFKMAAEDANYRNFFGGPADGFSRLNPSVVDPTLVNNEAWAESLTNSGDSWETVIDTPVDTPIDTTADPNIDNVTIPASISLGEVRITPAGSMEPSSYLVLIGEINAKPTIVVRTVARSPVGQRLYWSEEDVDGDSVADSNEDTNRNGILDTYPLPRDFVVNRVRVETWEPRYNWLLTVRKDDAGVSNVDIVVFFRRAFSLRDETVYDGLHQAPFSNNYLVSGFTASDPPAWKKGGYLFDLQNARWHRIQDVNTSTGQLILEGTPSAVGTRVMFLRGVLEVYPIGNKLP